MAQGLQQMGRDPARKYRNKPRPKRIFNGVDRLLPPGPIDSRTAKRERQRERERERERE